MYQYLNQAKRRMQCGRNQGKTHALGICCVSVTCLHCQCSTVFAVGSQLLHHSEWTEAAHASPSLSNFSLCLRSKYPVI